RSNVEYTGTVIAADCDDSCSWSGDSHVLGDRQGCAGQRDGAAQASLEVYRAPRGRPGNSIPERARSVISEVGDGTGNAAGLQQLQGRWATRAIGQPVAPRIGSGRTLRPSPPGAGGKRSHENTPCSTHGRITFFITSR